MLTQSGGEPEIAVLLFISAVTSFVLPGHVLDRLHAQYTLIRFDL